MPATIIVNNLTVVHKTSDGMVNFMPDVCLTPSPAGPIPIPYPNIAMSQDTDKGSETVKMDGNPIMLKGSVFSKSTGNEAGSNGGIISGVNTGEAEFINYSFDVKIEGKNVPRMGDLMLGNKGSAPNTPPMPEIQPPAVVIVADEKNEEESTDSLSVILVNGNDEPMENVKYILKKPDGSKEEGTTNSEGKIEVNKTISGVGKVLFPDLEKSSLTFIK